MNLKDFDFSIDTDSMKQDLDRVDQKPGQQTRSDKFVIFPKGEGVLTARLLPADTRKGHRLPYACSRLHYFNDRSFHCLKELEDGRWKKGSCPACSRYNFLYAESKKPGCSPDEIKTLVQQAKIYKPVERYYYNCIVRKETNPETGEVRLNVGPKILYVGKTLHGRILRAFLGNAKLEEAPLGNIAHPMTGRDFKIVKELVTSVDQNGIKREFPNYDSSKFAEESVLGDPKQIETWLDSMWDLESVRREELKSADEMFHQIDIAEGRASDDSLGFDPSDWDGNRNAKSVPQKAPETKASSKKPSVKDASVAPFDPSNDEDFAMADDDWAKEFQEFKSAVNDS